jgi:regulator of RNase E activity RraA
MANFDLYYYITRVLEINPRDIIVQDDQGIDVCERHTDITFEEAKKRRDNEFDRLQEFMANYKKKEDAE